MAIAGPITIHSAEVSASGLAKTIDLKSVNGTGYEALNGCAVGGAWTMAAASAVTFQDTDIDATANTITKTGHGLLTGDKGLFTTTTTLPTGIPASPTAAWIIRVSADVFQVADTLAHAVAGTALDIAADGTGTHTFTASAAAGTANIEESLDGTTWMAVTSTYGGSSQNIAAVSQFIWTYSGKCRYLRLAISPTGGRVTATIKLDTPIWND